MREKISHGKEPSDTEKIGSFWDRQTNKSKRDGVFFTQKRKH